MSETESLPHDKYAALFIDVQNLTHRTVDGQQQRYDLGDIHWPKLIERMFNSLQAEDIAYMGRAYTFAGDGRKRTQDWLQETLKRSFVRGGQDVPVFVRLVKDIDVAIVNDIWDYVIGLVQLQSDQKHKPPFEVTILLAGGDGAYAYPIKSIRRRFSSKLLGLRLHTFSWGESLSQELANTSNCVELLEKGALIL